MSGSTDTGRVPHSGRGRPAWLAASLRRDQRRQGYEDAKRRARRIPLPGFPWPGVFQSRAEIADYFSRPTIRCLLCGREGQSLGVHLRRVHNTTATEYQDRYALPRTRGLTSAAFHATARRRAIACGLGDAIRESPERAAAVLAAAAAASRAKKGQPKPTYAKLGIRWSGRERATVEQANCQHCGVQYDRGHARGTIANGSYCSRECYARAIHRETTRCLTCNTPLNHYGKQKRCYTCSKRRIGGKLGTWVRTHLALSPKPCVGCGRDFQPSLSRQTYCSRECRNTRYKGKQPEGS